MQELLIRKATMTSMEVAEVTGKQHCHITRDIQDEIKKLESAGIDTQSKFGLRERKDCTGRMLPYYELTKEGVLQLAARYDAVIRSKLIDIALNKQMPTIPLQTQLDDYTSQYKEAIRLYNVHLGEKLEYAEKHNQAADKVAQYDKIINSLSQLMNATRSLMLK